MSKGIGKLQRDILQHLAERDGPDYLGDDRHYPDVVLADGWHDLRTVTREMALKLKGIQWGPGAYFVGEANGPSSWQASFSRAVAGLAQRGFIEFNTGLVPIQRYYKGSRKKSSGDFNKYQASIHHLSDGLYLAWYRKRRRFCRLTGD
jgi:hypothetical protein